MPREAAEERIADVREGAQGPFWGEVRSWAQREEQIALASILAGTDLQEIFRLQGQVRMLRRIAGLPSELVEQIKQEESV